MSVARPSLERALLNTLGTGRDACIVASYYGWNGGAGQTLAAIGRELGLTRERVRQIVSAQSAALLSGTTPPRLLEVVLNVVASLLPASAEELETALYADGLISEGFRIESLAATAELFGCTVPFSITQVEGVPIVHQRKYSSLHIPARLARCATRQWGATTISEVASLAKRFGSGLSSPDLVASVLTSQTDFRWLDRELGWFWLSAVCPNRLALRVRKILSVANPVELSALRSGIARDYKMKSRIPPAPVLLEFCQQACGLKQNGDTVYADCVLDFQMALSPTERYVAKLLLDHGGFMSRAELVSGWAKKYQNERTLDQLLCYSPIIAKQSPGVYRLPGSTPRRNQANALRENAA